MIYLDNAATTWPKPESVYQAADSALRNAANPGRGGHRASRKAASEMFEARELIAGFFGIKDSRYLLFTSGATQSLNMVVNGLGNRVKRVVSAGYEHNALWRPLEAAKVRYNWDIDYLNPLAEGGFDWDTFNSHLDGADLVMVTHASNVTGEIYPLEEIVKVAKNVGALICADLSQTAGVVPMDFQEMQLDFAAFPGHKGLLGPQGVGCLYLAPGLDLEPSFLGGTGGNSVSPQAPEQLPERYESGTPNLSGIAGLAAGVSYLQSIEPGWVLAHETRLRSILNQGLQEIGATIYGGAETVGVLSFNIPGLDSSELAFILDDVYNIAVRGGLHCCPQGHKQLGTLDPGTVRVSPGIYNTPEDIKVLLAAVKEIVEQIRG